MYDPGEFIAFLQSNLELDSETSFPIIIPGGDRPQFPYATVLFISAQLSDIYQAGKELVEDSGGEKEVIEKNRNSIFSINVIDGPYGTAHTRAQEIHDLLFRQRTRDFFKGRGEAIQIIGDPQNRYVVEDDFDEQRVGFDILIKDLIRIDELDKDFIANLTVIDTSGKVGDVSIESGDYS